MLKNTEIANVRFYIPWIVNVRELSTVFSELIGTCHASVSLYGCLRGLAPSGRPNDMAASTRTELEALVRNSEYNGVATTYLMNGLGCGSSAWPESLLRWLRDSLRPSAVCVAEMDVARRLVEMWPDVTLEISTIAGCLESSQAETILSDPKIGMRVRAMCLHHDATSQNWQRTADFANWLLRRNIDPFVLVNESCMASCPARESHYRLFGSRARVRHTMDFLDTFQVGCVLTRLLEPWTLLDLSGFLLPSLMADFTAKTGIRGFKLAGRSMPGSWLSNAFRHYAESRDPENVYDIVVFTTPFLNRWRLTSADLFYVAAGAYREIHKTLADIPTLSQRREYLKTEAVGLFQSGQLRVRDPGCEYAVRDGKLVLIKPGEYTSFLHSLRLKGAPKG